MGKIPVGRTIGQSYEFAFQRYGAVLGIVWLPMVVLAAIGYFLFWPFLLQAFDQFPQMFQHPGGPDAAWMFSGAFAWLRLSEILVVLVFIVIRVGIAKEILGLRKGPKFVYVPSDSSELLVIACYIILYVGVIAVAVALVLTGVFIALIGGAVVAAGFVNFHAPAQQVWGALGLAAFAIATACAVIYVVARLIFLMIPATVAEHRIGIGRSWTLTRGNFWRIFVVVIAVWLPLIVLQGIVFSIVGGPIMLQFLAAAQDHHANARALIESFSRNMIYTVPWIWGVGLLFAPIFFSLTTAPSVFAYRALVAGSAPA